MQWWIAHDVCAVVRGLHLRVGIFMHAFVSCMISRAHERLVWVNGDICACRIRPDKLRIRRIMASELLPRTTAPWDCRTCLRRSIRGARHLRTCAVFNPALIDISLLGAKGARMRAKICNHRCTVHVHLRMTLCSHAALAARTRIRTRARSSCLYNCV